MALGMTARSVQRRLDGGRLHVLHRGVYAVGHRVLSAKGRWMAAVLAGGPDAVLSHRSAAALWNIRPTARARTDVTVGRNRRPRRGIEFHRIQLPDDEKTTHEGIPVTIVARTLIDLAKVLDRARLEKALAQAEIQRLHTGLPLNAAVQRHATRPGVKKLTAAIAKTTWAENITRSELEDRFLAFLDAHNLRRPETNVLIEGLEVDCVWRDKRVIVELDGRATHGTRQAFERDRERDRILQAAGWRVIRITWTQLHLQPAAVRRDLRKLLD
jgi:very-short-patch-repair endonuclease